MRMGWLLVGMVLWLGVASNAAALCVCGDRDGCFSAPGCVGQSPGDACTPPRAGSCKIKEGLGTETVCCCGCSRGAGPLACRFDEPVAAVATLETPPCDDAAAAKAGRRAAATLRRGLGQSQQRCLADKPGADKKLAAALRGLAKLRAKLDKLVARGTLADECAQAWLGIADGLDAAIAEVAVDGGRGTPPPTTTTTTLPDAGLACDGTLADADGLVAMSFTCAVEPGAYTGFDVTFSGHAIVASEAPPGFACSAATTTTPSDTWRCTGPFTLAAGLAAGRVELTPVPTPATTASLVLQGPGGDEGPFPMSWQ